MRIDDLQAFVALARLQSFHSAARLLNVSQSTLSARIHRLEQQLDARLFERTTRHVALSGAGERFDKHAQSLLAELEEAKRAVQAPALAASVRGHVIPSIDPVALQRALCTLHTREPDWPIEVRAATGQDALARAEAFATDFILLPQLLSAPSITKWQATLRLRERIAPFVSTAHPLASSRGLSLESKLWKSTPLVMLDLLWAAPKSLNKIQSTTSKAFVLPLDAAVEWALAAQGVLVTNAGMARRWVERGELVQLKLRDFPDVFRFLHLLRPRGSAANPGVTALAQELAKEMPCPGVELVFHRHP